MTYPIATAYTNLLTALEEFRNGELSVDETIAALDDHDKLTLILWYSLAEYTKSINPSLKSEIDKSPERYTKMLSPKDSNWIERMIKLEANGVFIS